MTVNYRLTPIGTADTGALCVSCGAGSVALSAGDECARCDELARRRRDAADELRTWKRYSPGSFR